MASIGRNLKNKGVIMTLLSLVLMNIGCEEQIDTTKIPNEGKKVEVSLNIGFADEADGYTVATKAEASSGKGAFSYELQPSVITKGNTVKPDKLYNLEIQQYDQSGNYIGGMNASDVTDHEIGSILNLSLAANTDCQLIIVAWGEGNTTPRLGTDNTLADVQKLSINASVINSIPTDNMNKMPYVLHLEHVCVEDNTIKSREGEDVRLLLKRLAARLTLDWTYSYKDYTLKQILLESIPTNYNVVPNPDKTDKTYPSLLDQFSTIQIDPASESGKSPYSCWIPANVRGTNLSATSQNFRIKANAPTGSSYASFIAVNDNDSKKKLNYRIYLGGSTSSDFNINSNTNYNYTVNFKHTGLPVNDYRVTIIDPIPASLNNDYLVPTANCFMVAPGGAFCFNPYKYTVNGEPVDNTLLQGWCNSNKIQSVKVLWQTKENGDVGDPVLGVVNSSADHTNIVDLNVGTDFDDARIYCRVAPNTTGGSGVIAAYDQADGKGNILWSWHIWVTDYAPDANANETVEKPENKRVQRYIHGNSPNAFPMMDRNLGAQAGYTEVPIGDLAKSKANGFHFQCGRKDPFPSTYSASLGKTLTINTDKLTPGMLNYYGPDGITYFVRTAYENSTDLRTIFQNPTTTYANNSTGLWLTGSTTNMWTEQTNVNLKTFHDPCPAGWRVASKTNYRSLFQNASYEQSSAINANQPMNIKNISTLLTDGGAVVYYENPSSGKTTYIRLTGYQPNAILFQHIGGMGNLWCRETGTQNGWAYSLTITRDGLNGQNIYNISGRWTFRDAHPVRCIQDRYKNE